MASGGDKKMITLRSSDSVAFEVEEAVAMASWSIRDMIGDGCADDDNGISLPSIHSKILSKVIEYCEKHVNAAAKPAAADSAATDGEDLKNWDAEFVDVDLDTLLDLVVAADYLNIEGLQDLSCQTVSDMIEGNTLHEIRNMLTQDDEMYEIRMSVARLLLD